MFFLDRLESCKSWLNVESIDVRCSCCSIVDEESSFKSSRNAMKTAVEFLLSLSIAECSSRFDFSSACVLSSRVSSSLHRSESFASRDFSHDQRKSRRTRDEVSSTSRSETRDLLQISIHLLSKNDDYWDDEVLTCVIYSLNDHRSRSLDASTARIFLLESQRHSLFHFARKYCDRNRLVMFSSLFRECYADSIKRSHTNVCQTFFVIR